MKVLMVSGDTSFGPGHPRYELQRSAVESLTVIYWGRGALRPLVPKDAYDVVTVQDPFWRGLFAWRLARRFRARLNVQVHADLDSQSLAKRTLARFVLRRADSVRVVSEKIRRQVEKLGVHQKITVLPVYIDVESFRAIKREPHSRKTILWVGRFEEEKNPEAAFPILRLVREAGIDASLVLLGAGNLGVRLKSAHNLDFAEIPTEFPGWADPSYYISRADVVINTSKQESFGASIVEALAAGVPVVSPDVGIAREAGAIVVPREKLADAVIDVLRHGAKAELKLSPPSAEEWMRQWRQSLA